MNFDNLNKLDDRTYSFTLSPIHVTYANTLRRLILTGVETIAFRSDMTSTGSTTDVVVKRNDTPMTNEMLADRIGLIPINITEPLSWKEDKYIFTLKVAGNKDNTTYVKSGDFIMAHDYAENREVFENQIYLKVWNWHEISDSDIRQSCEENNLEIFDKETFENVAWTCRKKL